MRTNTSARFAGQATNWLTRITPKTLRFRLVLWVIVILCSIQLGLGAAFYVFTSNWLQGQLDNSLSDTATQVAATLQGTDVIDNGKLNFAFNDGDQPADAFLKARRFFIRVIDQEQGRVIETSAPYDITITTQASARNAGYETLPLESANTPMRVYTMPLEDRPLALQAGVSMVELYATQGQIFHMIIASLLLTALLGGGVGLFLATRALIPIQAITRTAQQISERDLSQRIILNLSDDELGQLARTFNTMLDRIEQAFQRQLRFTADAAHELRTPLSIMQTGIEVILTQERSPEQYRLALESVQEEVHRLTSLTVSLMTLARADSHTLTMHRVPIDFSMLVSTVVDQLTPLAEQKMVSTRREIQPQIGLQADEDRIIQLALNLIENAIKYTPKGGSVTVSVLGAGNAVRFVVTDTGPGIPSEHLKHIFDRFYRMDRSRNRDEGGFGLGLAIAQQIVHLHRGEIKVSSQIGVGTEFLVTLPID